MTLRRVTWDEPSAPTTVPFAVQVPGASGPRIGLANQRPSEYPWYIALSDPV